MAEAPNPLSILQTLYGANQAQLSALQQPTPRQGGFLSNADPVMLSLAAGLLSPTKTGSFGESIGSGLAAAQGPLAELRRQEAAKSDKQKALMEAQAKLAMDIYDVQTGGRRGRFEDPSMVAKRLTEIADQYDNSAKFLDDKDPRKAQLMTLAQSYRQKANAALGIETPELGAAPVPTEEESGGGGWFDWLTGGGKSKPKETAKEPTKEPEVTGKTEAKPYTGNTAPPDYPDAKKGKDGYWYVKQGNGYSRVVE